MGNKGRIVVPASIRALHEWVEGSTLIALNTPIGLRQAGLVTAQRTGKEMQYRVADQHVTQAEHSLAEHERAVDCGHESVTHDDHADFMHDGHKHALHGDQYDEH